VAAAGHLYSKTELKTIGDLKGMKIRSYSPTTARMIELMGGQPVTVQAADLTQALSTGVVSANLTSGGHRLRHQELGAAQPLLRHPGLAAEEHRVRVEEGLRRARPAAPRCGC
jgi:hypothetical protein